MSGILGVWNLDGRPIETSLLSRLAGTLAHRGPDGQGCYVDGSVGLACRIFRVTPESATETQPHVAPSGVALVFDGRLDNRDELLPALSRWPGICASSPDPALALAAYHAFGIDFVNRLLGDFALGLFDPGRRHLVLARDAIGLRPLYYYRAANLFLFASEIKAILAHPQVPTRPNDVALAEFLILGPGAGCAGETTFFDRVCRVVPAHLAIVTADGFVSRRYWDFDPARQIRFGSSEQYTEAFRHHFSLAVQRRLRSSSPVAVSVSGGLDSSAVYCVAETLRRADPGRFPRLQGISSTFEDGTPSDEKAYLSAIERTHGVSIERIPSNPSGLLDDCTAAVWHIEAPLLGAQWNNGHAFLTSVERRGAKVLLTGSWGDQFLFDPAYLMDLVAGGAWGTVARHLQSYGRWCTDVPRTEFVKGFFKSLLIEHAPKRLRSSIRYIRSRRRTSKGPGWYAPAFRNLALHRTRSEEAMAWGAFATAHARSLYREARSDYHVLCMEWNNKVAAMHGLDMAFPFLDRDLISFLMAIPGEVQHQDGVPKAILREAVRDILPDAIANRTWKADFTAFVNDGLVRDYPRLADLLASDAATIRLGYSDSDTLRAGLAHLRGRIQARSAVVGRKFADLIGLELWLRVFFNSAVNRTEDILYARPA